MSCLVGSNGEDSGLHFADGTHMWVKPPGSTATPDEWEKAICDHVAEHSRQYKQAAEARRADDERRRTGILT